MCEQWAEKAEMDVYHFCKYGLMTKQVSYSHNFLNKENILRIMFDINRSRLYVFLGCDGGDAGTVYNLLCQPC